MAGNFYDKQIVFRDVFVNTVIIRAAILRYDECIDRYNHALHDYNR